MGYEAEVGNRIRELRSRSGVTADQLAKAVGLSPSAVSRIEHGTRALKSDELTAIAEALGVSPLAILDGDSLLGRLPVAARAVDGGRVAASTIIDRLTGFAELDDVLRNGSIPARPQLAKAPEVDPQNWLSAANALAGWANSVFEDAEVDPALERPFDRLVFLISTELNIDVAVEDHEDELLGAAITDPSFPFIFVNSNQPSHRCIFTLAHELGHVLSHNGELVTLDRELTARSDNERLANAFAAALLMPEQQVMAQIESEGRGAGSLARMLLEFGVSYESLIYRLHNLRIINGRGRDQLRRVGWTGLLAQVDDPALRGQLVSARSSSTPRFPPLPLAMRLGRGWLQGVVSIRPLAELLGEDPEDLATSFEAAQSVVSEQDYSDSPADSAEELYAGSPV